ncbi:MAG: hypothetical protein E7021_00405 [Alphaproteobacteria bacterium]|nr:hypothetical protein [Alphaproteobacteria bacterium]
MRETVRKKLKDGHIQVTYYYHPRSFWDVLLGRGQIEDIMIFDKNGKKDGECISYRKDGSISSRCVYKKNLLISDENYDTKGKLHSKKSDHARTTYIYRPDGTKEEEFTGYQKYSYDPHFEDSIRTTWIPDGHFVEYDQNEQVVDKGVRTNGKTIKDRKGLTEFLDSVTSKGNKKHTVREYREVFPKTEQEKAERKAERVARQKKIKELKAQGK